jgi:hypothetical protein
MEMEMFCQVCMVKVVVVEPKVIILRNGETTYEGECPVCGATLLKKRKG